MRITYGPLSDEVTGFNMGPYKESNFRVNWSQAVSLLEGELEKIRTTDAVLEIDVERSAFRLDGGLRADRKPRTNRVRLIAETSLGTLTYPLDTFVRGYSTYWMDGKSHPKMAEDWKHNVYAIAKGLEALRMLDRYGISGGQQYQGFLALEATASGMGPAAAVDLLASMIGWSKEEVRLHPDQAFKAARKRAHPDVNDGSQVHWDQAVAAARALGVQV